MSLLIYSFKKQFRKTDFLYELWGTENIHHNKNIISKVLINMKSQPYSYRTKSYLF